MIRRRSGIRICDGGCELLDNFAKFTWQELAEIKINAPAKLEAERRKRQIENVHTILSPKQLELFKMLSQGEKSYTELLETARINKLDIHDMPALRVQISRLNKKLERETVYKIERIQR